jgi:hypothetical protein
VAKYIDPMIDCNDYDVAVARKACPSKPGAVPAQFIQAPPCSQTMTGLRSVDAAEGAYTFKNRQSSLTASIFVYQAAIGKLAPGIWGAELPGIVASRVPVWGFAGIGAIKRVSAVLSP